MKSAIAQCRFMRSMSEPILAGLTDDHLALEPQPGAKTAGWLIGHLSVTGDFGRKLCGRPPICPKEWRAIFNPGTQPSHDRSIYPPMSALCATLHAVYDDLIVAAGAANPSALAVENPFAPGRAGFPTSGDFVRYMMSAHFSWHLGQLSTWRAAAGLGRLPRSDAIVA